MAASGPTLLTLGALSLGCAGAEAAAREESIARRATSSSVPEALRVVGDAQTFTAEFRDLGVTVEARRGAARVLLTPARYGCAGALAAVNPARPEASGDRIEYRHHSDAAGALVEWYVNDPRGLEQGFTLPADPCSQGSAPAPERETEREIIIELALAGDLTATLDEGARTATLRDASGRPVMRYTDLHAIDAAGRELPAQLEAHGARLALHVDGRGASYPLVIDPLLWTETPPHPIVPKFHSFGDAMSNEDSLVIIGVPDDDNPYGGAVYVFDRDTNAPLVKLVPKDGVPGDRFGASVAIDWKTHILVVGAPGRKDASGKEVGTVYFFKSLRSGKKPDGTRDVAWEQVGTLTPTDKLTELAHFGQSVSAAPYVDEEDTPAVVIVGAPGQAVAGAANAGAAYLFEIDRNGAVTVNQHLLPNDSLAQDDRFGAQVSTSLGRILVGAPGHNGGKGAAYFTPKVPSSASVTLVPLATPATLDAKAAFGSAVACAVTDDKQLFPLVVGAPMENGGKGAAYIFRQQSAGSAFWVQSARLAADDGPTDQQFGAAVAMFAITAVVGAPGHQPGNVYGYFAEALPSSAQSKVTPLGLKAPEHPSGGTLGNSAFVTVDSLVVGVSSSDSTFGLTQNYKFMTSMAPDKSWLASAQYKPNPSGDHSTLEAPVALSGDTMIVGVPSEGDIVAGAGAAYVFQRTAAGWTRQARLTSPVIGKSSFGAAVATDGNIAVIGAPDATNPSTSTATGMVYIFERKGSAWSLPKPLTGSDLAAGDRFGAAVAMSGQNLLVGAPQRTTMGGISRAGAVYPFTKSGETFQPGPEFSAPAPMAATNESFGVAVALDGDLALVGAPTHSPGGTAYLCAREAASWSCQKTLNAKDKGDEDAFGSVVALRNNRALVGAPHHDMTGAAYIFAESDADWDEATLLPLPDDAKQSSFGAAVALSKDTAVVGAATRKDKDGKETGAVYTYLVTDDVWSKPNRVTSSGTEGGFGAAVAVDDQHLAVTAPRSKPASTVYVFEPGGGRKDGEKCDDHAQCAGNFCVTERCCTHDCASLYGCTTAEDPSDPPRPLPALALLGGGALALALRRRRAS